MDSVAEGGILVLIAYYFIKEFFSYLRNRDGGGNKKSTITQAWMELQTTQHLEIMKMGENINRTTLESHKDIARIKNNVNILKDRQERSA